MTFDPIVDPHGQLWAFDPEKKLYASMFSGELYWAASVDGITSGETTDVILRTREVLR